VFLVTELSNGALETLWVAMAMALEANQEPMWILVLEMLWVSLNVLLHCERQWYIARLTLEIPS